MIITFSKFIKRQEHLIKGNTQDSINSMLDNMK